jgi:hypothetical protein
MKVDRTVRRLHVVQAYIAHGRRRSYSNAFPFLEDENCAYKIPLFYVSRFQFRNQLTDLRKTSNECYATEGELNIILRSPMRTCEVAATINLGS